MAAAVGSVLVSVGDVVEDIVVWLDGPPRRGTDTPSSVHRHRGGSAANVAAFAATLGARSRFIGQIGTDDVGDRLVADLQRCGVEVRVRRAGVTGTIVVLVEPDGERTMLSDRAAATGLTDVPDAWLDDVGVLHLPCYSFHGEPLATTSSALARRAGACGATVSVDLSSLAVIDALGADRLRDLLAVVRPTVVFATAEEAAAVGLVERPLGVDLVVVKDGPRPVTLHAPGRAPRSVPVPAQPVRDSTGAGDAFAAGFLAAHLRGVPPEAAAAAAVRAAARVLAEPGASMGNDS